MTQWSPVFVSKSLSCFPCVVLFFLDRRGDFVGLRRGRQSRRVEQATYNYNQGILEIRHYKFWICVDLDPVTSIIPILTERLWQKKRNICMSWLKRAERPHINTFSFCLVHRGFSDKSLVPMALFMWGNGCVLPFAQCNMLPSFSSSSPTGYNCYSCYNFDVAKLKEKRFFICKPTAFCFIPDSFLLKECFSSWNLVLTFRRRRWEGVCLWYLLASLHKQRRTTG